MAFLTMVHAVSANPSHNSIERKPKSFLVHERNVDIELEGSGSETLTEVHCDCCSKNR